MKVTFWGVRGSIATSGEGYARMGGNTTCVEVEAEGHRVIIDAGTGLRNLGQKLVAELKETGKPIEATMLFTHYHWDHIQGFPFFAPAYIPTTRLSIHGPVEDGGVGPEQALSQQMQPPGFPVPLSVMGAHKQFHTLQGGDVLQVGPIQVRARPLLHPQGSFGYRFDVGGRSFCFATDTEHPEDGSVDGALLDLAKDVDLLVYDAQYTLDEYLGRNGAGPSKKGWGHSTVEAAAQAARASGARSLGLFHHDPNHDDRFVLAMEHDAKALFANTFATREGLTVTC